MKSQRSVVRALIFAAALSVPTISAAADDIAAWKLEREARFATVKAAHPPQEGVIAAIKSKTETLIAAYAPPPGPALDHPPVVWRTQAEPVVVFDVAVAPRMVVVPAGEFSMGSPVAESGHRADEAPRRRVRIDHAIAVSMFPVTDGEYAYFAGTTGRKSASACTAPDSGKMRSRADRDWQNPGFPQTQRSPVVCVTFEDAAAYAAWLCAQTGQKYRLLSEAEYEYANRAGTSTAYWWGDDRAAGCSLVNGLDVPAAASNSSASSCEDGFAFSMPLDKSKANPFGIFDTTGNVASWTADCWRATYAPAPAGAQALTTGDCRTRVVRGGSWSSPAAALRSAARARAPIGEASADRGFRVVRDL